MEDNRLITFVFDATKLDEYQRGFISGIMYFLTGKPNETPRWSRYERKNCQPCWIKDLKCTADQSLAVRDEIEKHFPGVIIEIN